MLTGSAANTSPIPPKELVDLIADIKPTIPRYCRVNRVIRDIPSTNVVEGNKRTSLRQDVHAGAEAPRAALPVHPLPRSAQRRQCDSADAALDDLVYAGGEPRSISCLVTPDDRLAGFLRLSLPGAACARDRIGRPAGAAIIREVHVYGQSLPVGDGAGRRRPAHRPGHAPDPQAEEIARQHGFRRLAVIAAVGTRRYYLERGFQRGDLYLVKDL